MRWWDKPGVLPKRKIKRKMKMSDLIKDGQSPEEKDQTKPVRILKKKDLPKTMPEDQDMTKPIRAIKNVKDEIGKKRKLSNSYVDFLKKSYNKRRYKNDRIK